MSAATDTPAERPMPDPIELLRGYADLGAASRRELQRAVLPDDLRSIGAFYALLPGRRPRGGDLRLVYLLPYVRHSETGPGLGGAIAETGVSESRFKRLLASEPPADLRSLVEIARAYTIVGNWPEIARSLYYWGPAVKSRVAEDYWVRTSSHSRRAKL